MLELIKNPDYRYIRALGMLYFRMTTHDPVRIYKTLEPYYADYRRLALRNQNNTFSIIHMD